MRRNLFQCFVFAIILPNVLHANEVVWDKIKECDNKKIIIEKNGDLSYRLTMNGEAVDYFVTRGALPLEGVTQNHEFHTDLFKHQGHFRSIVHISKKENIFFDLYDYGHITLVATKNSYTQNNGEEIAAWNYRYCR